MSLIMLDQHEIESAAAVASELLLDFGSYITGGRRPSRAIVALAWLTTVAGAIALWRGFPWLFDQFPGWAVLAGGAWIMLLILSVGLFGAAVKYGAASNYSVSDVPFKEP
jgi:hypothetical protein